MSVTPIVIVHGGSRAIAPNEVAKRRYKDGVLQAARIGYETLLKVKTQCDSGLEIRSLCHVRYDVGLFGWFHSPYNLKTPSYF